jgi:diguanylate cyclase (GGDEF)-like protein
LKSIRFALLAIAICGIAVLCARIQINIWEGQARVLATEQEAIGAQAAQLRDALDAMLDLETGQRGYMLTGEEAYLEPYESGRRNIDAALQRLNEMFRNDPIWIGEIDQLAKLANAKEDELDRTIKLRRDGDFLGAIAIVKTDIGKQHMDKFREKVNYLLPQLRLRRSDLVAQEMQKFADLSVLGFLVFALIMVLIALAIGFLNLSIHRLKDLQMQREQEAMHDALTTLPNRRFLQEWLTFALAGCRRNGEPLVLLYCDLDGFKAVNDRFGHEAGDQVLQATAARLRRGVRSSDFVARLGGDEFVAVLPNAPDASILSALVARLRDDLAKAPIEGLTDDEISASIGVASYPLDGDTADTLLAAADRAMYQVKQNRSTRHGTEKLAAEAAATV